MKKLKFQAFTLVELLIVVAILAVLATVGFVSYSNYLTGVRDTNRVTQLVGIRNAIETFKTTKDTPLPEEKIDIKVNGELIAYQGIVGQNILNQIGLSDGGTDPKDETYFPYYLTKDRKYFQLMTFLEDEPDTEEELTFFPQTYALTDYSIRYPKVIGFPLGILTQKDTNTPLHEIESLTGTLDVATTSDEYTAYFMDEETITGSGDVLPSIAQNASCKRILDMGKSKGDGFYTINPTGSESFQVYCDMITDGGGWTRITIDDARNIYGGTINVLENGVDSGFIDNKPYVVHPGNTTNHYNFNSYFTWSEFYISADYLAKSASYLRSGSDTSEIDYLLYDWRYGNHCIDPDLSGSKGDIGFGSATDNGPITSFFKANGEIEVIECNNCTFNFPGGTSIYQINSFSHIFRIGFGECGGQSEGWFPWWQGYIYLR